MGLNKYQRGREAEVHRTELKNAPYNPRKINKHQKAKLKKNIEKVGLLGGIVWNKNTGNIVSGHQRVSALDALQGSCDYMVLVTPVEMDEKTEKEQNIFMNNTEAQGDFDLEKLEEIMADDFDLDAAGFDVADKFKMFGMDSMDTDEAVKIAEELRESRDLFDKIKKKNIDRDADDFYCVVVFKDNTGRQELAKILETGDHRYLDGERLLERLNDN